MIYFDILSIKRSIDFENMMDEQNEATKVPNISRQSLNFTLTAPPPNNFTQKPEFVIFLVGSPP